MRRDRTTETVAPLCSKCGECTLELDPAREDHYVCVCCGAEGIVSSCALTSDEVTPVEVPVPRDADVRTLLALLQRGSVACSHTRSVHGDRVVLDGHYLFRHRIRVVFSFHPETSTLETVKVERGY